MRARTQDLHARAERTGVVRDMLAGRVDRDSYALLLRNLLPAYEEIERGLERHRAGLPGLARPELFRAAAIMSDLMALCGPDWRVLLPLLPAGRRYAHRVTAAAEGDGRRLIAHAYVRYLGDLSGGQMLKRTLTRTLGLAPGGLAFHAFPGIADIAAFTAAYRSAIDAAGRAGNGVDDVVAEAAVAFRLNIHLSEAVQLAAGRLRVEA